MEDKLLLTYSLLAHFKETSDTTSKSLIGVFVPIVKKGLSEYSKENKLTEIKGANLSEIQVKIKEIFLLEIPIPILNIIMIEIEKQIADETTFKYFSNDGAFIIKSYIFNDIEELIKTEENNLSFLENDFINYCKINNIKLEFNELINFILAQKVDLFSDKKFDYLDVNYQIPKYLKLKFNDDRTFKIISDIYLGGILTSYLTLNINEKITSAELLIDTNFFISLIDLNTEDSFLTSNQLFDICKRMGFRFTILYSTVDEIRSLLNNRIIDFRNKEYIGSIKTADIFNACIRRKIDKTELERIKDNVLFKIQDLGIVVIQEAQIKEIKSKAEKSQSYKDLKIIRHTDESALNDAIAEEYVKQKRGKNINEFSDVKCWFLHNSYNKYDFTQSQFIHQRYQISSNELLALLWLSNPSQIQIETQSLAKSALNTYVTKYRRAKIPTRDILNEIKDRADKAIETGNISNRDLYLVTVRMSEGQLKKEDIDTLVSSEDATFKDKFIEFAKEDDEKVKNYDNQIKERDEKIRDLENEILSVKSEKDLAINSADDETQKLKDKIYSLELQNYEEKRKKHIDNTTKTILNKNRWFSYLYIFILFGIVVIYIISQKNENFIPSIVPLLIGGSGIVVPFISKMFKEDFIANKFKTTFDRDYRNELINEITKKYDMQNPKPEKL